MNLVLNSWPKILKKSQNFIQTVILPKKFILQKGLQLLIDKANWTDKFLTITYDRT